MRLVRPRSVQASSAAWPGITNTGVPAGTSLTPFSGNFNTSSNGQIVEDLDITGAIVVQHNDVIIRRCRASNSDQICGLFVASSAHGTLLVEDTELDCQNGAGRDGIHYDTNATPPAITMRRLRVRRCENGFNVDGSNFDLQDSLVHELNPAGADPHTDGLQCSAGISNVTIKHNTFDFVGPESGPNNSCIQFNIQTLDNVDWLIENNLLLLNATIGGSCVRIPTGDATGNNIRIRNNRLKQGLYGYYLSQGGGVATDHVTEWSGNVDYATGAAVT